MFDNKWDYISFDFFSVADQDTNVGNKISYELTIAVQNRNFKVYNNILEQKKNV